MTEVPPDLSVCPDCDGTDVRFVKSTEEHYCYGCGLLFSEREARKKRDQVSREREEIRALNLDLPFDAEDAVL